MTTHTPAHAPTAQLALLERQPEWRLDEHTRRVGRQGLAEARAALAASTRARSQDPPVHAAAGSPPAPAVEHPAASAGRRKPSRRATATMAAAKAAAASSGTARSGAATTGARRRSTVAGSPAVAEPAATLGAEAERAPETTPSVGEPAGETSPSVAEPAAAGTLFAASAGVLTPPAAARQVLRRAATRTHRPAA
jgi:hypothetical protein